MATPKPYGWFRYGRRHPEGKVGEWTITRTPDDPPVVVWRVPDGGWIIDDDPGDQHVQVDGFSEDDIRVALAFAQAMGWLPADVRYEVRPLSASD